MKPLKVPKTPRSLKTTGLIGKLHLICHRMLNLLSRKKRVATASQSSPPESECPTLLSGAGEDTPSSCDLESVSETAGQEPVTLHCEE